jgi:hypothetical protein
VALLASTRTIFAPGATAWIHSTSRASSTSQLTLPEPLSDLAFAPFLLQVVARAKASSGCVGKVGRD